MRRIARLMAEKYTIMMISDLDGTTGSEDEIGPVDFALDGKYYEIDLTKSQADELRDKLRPFIAAARFSHITASAAPPQVKRKAIKRAQAEEAEIRRARKQENDKIRDWARAMGMPVSTRRIAADTANAYHKWIAEQERRAQTQTPPTEPRATAPAVPDFIAPAP